MKKVLNYLAVAGLALAVSACSKEAPETSMEDNAEVAISSEIGYTIPI